MADDYKCKYCGEEFENKGYLVQHYTKFKRGTCATGKEDGESLNEGAVEEGMGAERDPASVPKPHYDTDAETVDITEQQGVEAQVSALAKDTAEKLKKYPKERVMIPEDKLNPQSSFVVVGINGWNLQIQRKTPVILPSPVVELLEQGGYAPTRVR